MNPSLNISSIIKNLLFATLGILLACIVGELLVRIGTADQKNYVIEMWRYAKYIKQPSLDPDIGHSNQPHKTAMLQGVEIAINSFGLRGPEPDLKSAKHTIAILGDSAALGWGVSEDENLRGQLSKLMDTNTEVINSAVCNMNLSQIVAHWSKISKKIQADTVILLCTSRAPEQQRTDDAGWLVRHSQLTTLLVTFFQQLTSGAIGKENFVDATRARWHSTSGQTIITSALNRLVELQTTQKFKVILALQPESHDFNHYQFDFMTKIMKIEAEKRGWHFVDLLPVLQGPPTETYWVSSEDIHLNGNAYRLIANHLRPLLQNNVPPNASSSN